MASFSKVDDNLMQIPPELMQFVKRDTYSLPSQGQFRDRQNYIISNDFEGIRDQK